MKWNDKKPYLYAMLAGFGTIALSVMFFFVIYRFQGFSGGIQKLMNILAPFVYGAAIAYVLKPACNFLDAFLQKILPPRAKKASGPLSVAIALLGAIILVYALFLLIIPQLVNSILVLINTIPGYINDSIAWVESLLANDPKLVNTINSFYTSVAEWLDNWVRTSLTPYLKELLNGFGDRVMNFVSILKNIGLGTIVAVYLLLARHKYSRQAQLVLYSLVRRNWADKILCEVDYANRMFEGFISGKLLDSLIIGLVCYGFVLLTGVRNAMLVAVIIGVTNIIPFFGPFIGAVPSLLLILMESPMKALWFLIFIIILQQIDGNILGPKILGNTTGLSSFWVLFAILLFGGLWGFVGMILAVPLFAVIYDVLRKLIFRGLHYNGCDAMLEQYHRHFAQQTPKTPPRPPKAGSRSS